MGAAWSQAASGAPVQVQRDDRVLDLSYNLQLELPRTLADALQRGVPLHFVVEARVRRVRWYWRDATLAAGQRSWRLTYQPLTRQYRVASTGGLSRSYETLDEALGLVRRAGRWSLDLREEPALDAEYELDFSLKLDVSQLPGPVQIGLGTRATLDVGQTRRLHPMELGLVS